MARNSKNWKPELRALRGQWVHKETGPSRPANAGSTQSPCTTLTWAQTAAKLVLEPNFGADLEDSAYGRKRQTLMGQRGGHQRAAPFSSTPVADPVAKLLRLAIRTGLTANDLKAI